MNIDYEAIGRRIRTRRIQKSMTQEQLAALIEREPAYLSRIEHGNQKPSLDTLLRISNALKLDINNLLSDVQESRTATWGREVELLLEGCSIYEATIIIQSAVALKNILQQCRM